MLNSRSVKGKTPLEMVQLAVRDHVYFKLVSRELSDAGPCKEAVQWLVDAHEQGEAPSWLTAHLLGQNGHDAGYGTVKRILEAGPGSLAESYAGPSLARIDSVRASSDLADVLLTGTTRRIREGAAYGLAVLNTNKAREEIVDAVRDKRVSQATAAAVLQQFPEIQSWLRELLGDVDERIVKVSLFIVEALKPDQLDPELVDLAQAALTATTLAPRTRDAIVELLEAAAKQWL